MSKIWSLTKRNLLHYYRDKQAFFFSFLSVFIVIGVYIFFLADLQINGLKGNLGNLKDIKYIIYTWIIGGLLCIPAMSVPLIILTFKVEDIAERVQDDLLITPAKRSEIMFGYIIAAWIAGVLMTTITLIICELFLALIGGMIISIVDFVELFGMILLIVSVFTCFSFFIIIRLRTNSALVIVNTILNTLIGFLAGLYFPIGFISDKIALVIKLFPLSQAAALLRRIIMKGSMDHVFHNLPDDVIREMRNNYGIDIVINKHTFTAGEMVIYLTIFGVIFLSASMLIYKKQKIK